MPNHTTREGLIAAVDYILNAAGEREIEVITAAAERKRQALSAGLPLSVSPERMAKQMAESVNRSISASLDGVRNTFRNFAADLLQKEAPELSEEQMMALIDSWIPAAGSYGSRSSVENGQSLPPEALYEMIIQFVAYGIGEMPESENKKLKETMGNWTEKYWKHFSPQVRGEIKSFINGEITSGEFQKNIKPLIS